MGPQIEPIGATDTQAAFTQVLRVCQDSQGVMGQVLTEILEINLLQTDTYQEVAGIHTKEASINTNMASLVCVLWDINTTFCRTFLQASTPPCGQSPFRASTSARATGREALSEEDTPAHTPVSAAADSPLWQKEGTSTQKSRRWGWQDTHHHK